MSSSTLDDDERIGPELRLEELAIPPHVGERLAALHGRDGRLDDGAEWVEAIRSEARDLHGEPPSESDLCTSQDGPHNVSIGDDTTSYICVLDPLVVPFLRGEPGTIRSKTPEDGENVTIEIEPDGVTATPTDAVISLGVSHDIDADEKVSREAIYAWTCPYIHAFATVDEYERWDGSVDAATTSVSVETGVAIARELANELFGE